MQIWAFLSAANWGFAALMLAVGYGLGWWRGRWIAQVCTRPSGHDGPCNGFPRAGCAREAGSIVVPGFQTPSTELVQAGGNPATPVFQTQSGQAVESPRIWDQRLARFGGPEQIPYEELEGMFLDQFLLRYFYSLMPLNGFVVPAGSRLPWDAFVEACPWAKEMPILFEQMTGYKLNKLQLNNAIAEWTRRLSKSSEVAT